MNKYLFGLALFSALMITSMSHAAIDSITMTPAGPTTLSNGRAYYLAGQTYTFHVQATDPLATVKGQWTSIYVEFRQGAATPHQNFTITIGPDTFAGTGVDMVGTVQDLSGGPYNAIHYAVTVRFRWDGDEYAYGANNIFTRVTNANGSATDLRPLNHGVITHVRMQNFAQSGEAADGRLNPWHNGFNVTGAVVYASGAELITNTVPDVSASALYLDGGATAPDIPDNGATVTPVFVVPDLYCNDHSVALGNHAWRVVVSMTNPGGPVQSDNTLAFNCNRIEVEWVRFESGGGVNTPYYLRSVNVTGTRIRVRARLQSGGGAMAGNTTFIITDNAASTTPYTVQINSGQFEGTALISPMPDATDVTAGTTVPVNYTVSAVYGGAYDGNAPPGVGQDDPSKITGSGSVAPFYTVHWDNADAPGSNAPLYPGTFTTFTAAPSMTATSITFQWTVLSTALPGAPPLNYDADFDTYRIYYRTPPSAGPWTMVDRNTTGYGTLGTITTNTIDVTGLDPLTDYDYRFSAVDTFGNEVPLASQLTGTVSTTATSIRVSITDGISHYTNTNFNNRDPAAHPVRDTAIKISVKIITAGNMPDRVAAIIANNDSDLPGVWTPGPWPPPPGQYGATGGTANSIVDDLPADQQWSITCAKVSPNTYEGYIPSEHPLMKYGNNIRLIVATTVEGITTYSDHTVETGPPGEYINDEWRFRVATKAILIPWPTRVLNNVMTAELPCCFPAYFLTIDSAVTIKVYDAKGRVIATLADRMYRPGGQNIKEMGWCGLNKDNRRVGPGLYYIHIKAVTIGGKVVLDKMMKVVMAH